MLKVCSENVYFLIGIFGGSNHCWIQKQALYFTTESQRMDRKYFQEIFYDSLKKFVSSINICYPVLLYINMSVNQIWD